MTQSARTKTWQRIIDCIIGAIIAALGVAELVYFLGHPKHHQIQSVAWACLLAASGIVIILGALLRTVRPGRRQSVGFQCELAGWGASAFLIFWYAVIDFFLHNPDIALFGALLLIVTMLLGSWLRLVSAMHEVTKGRP